MNMDEHERDDHAALRRLLLLAAQGNASAQAQLGHMYAIGDGVLADVREAASWFRMAAEQGDADAQFWLGFSYAHGEGVRADDQEAAFWYREAAEQGHARAQFWLGLSCADGKGVRADDYEAVFWYRKAAEQGHAGAQYNLGLSYADGEGVRADDQEAVFWYRQAAEQGHADAQYNLGRSYADGEGVRADDQEAVSWYRKAAEQGHAVAQFMLGWCYACGGGVPADYVQAYAWINLASDSQQQRSQQHMTSAQIAEIRKLYAKAQGQIVERMTSTEVAEAQELSRQLAAWIAGDADESTPASISGDPARASGPSNETVRQAQSYLALLGYDAGLMDGLPDQRTTDAVRQFQQDQGVTPTGRISEELLALLRAMAGIRQNRPTDPVSSGSGFLVGGDGWIVTNHHVVDGCARVTVSYAGTSYDATVQAVEARDDLALLKVAIEVGEVATFSESPRASLGETATVAGYPLHGLLSKEINVTSGNVSALAGLGDDAKLLQITAPVQQGNSGGPLLDGAGNVIGVVESKLDAARAAKMTGDIPQNINFAIKGAVVRSFLDIHGVAYVRRPSNTKLTSEQLAERARTFTVAVHCWD